MVVDFWYFKLVIMCYVAMGLAIWVMPVGDFKFIDNYVLPFAKRLYYLYTVMLVVMCLC